MVQASSLLVDVIIPIHDLRRAIERAVRSIIDDPAYTPQRIRLTLVAHNLPADAVAGVLGPNLAERVRLISLFDGIQSPAGPFTLGVQEATAKYVSIMGSDDWLEEGALEAWLECATRSSADVVIAPQRHQAGGRIPTPPIRPLRRGALDSYRDRLVYRTAPLGLLRRSLISDLELAFPGHLKNGSDQLFTLALWNSPARVVYPKAAPSYIVGADAPSRVTTAARPAREGLQAITELVESSTFSSLDLRNRRAVVAKLVRVHVFSGALVLSETSAWSAEEHDVFRGLLQRFGEVAPGYLRLLSLADRRVVKAILRTDLRSEVLRALLVSRSKYGRPSTVFTPDLRGLLAVHGPLRFFVASRLLVST